jgi:hypothetical protein
MAEKNDSPKSSKHSLLGVNFCRRMRPKPFTKSRRTMHYQKEKTIKPTFDIDLRNNKLTAADLLSLVEAIYPDPDKPDSNPINDVAVVLMSAALI